MKRRGRPPYPDILTPRQQEVLALLREGLTNDQIAERLNISPDGAKFHVSEIIGRLGVADRHEAAEWQPDAARPRGGLAAIAPLALLRRATPTWVSAASAPASATIVVVAAAGVALLAWGVITMRDSAGRSVEPTPALPVARVGVPAVDQTIDLLVHQDVTSLLSLVQFTTIGCSVEQTVGSPPSCPAGAADGTPLQAFPIGQCEGAYATTIDEVHTAFGGALSRQPTAAVYAVLRGNGTSGEGYSAAITQDQPSQATAPVSYWYIATDGRITGLQFECGPPGAAQQTKYRFPNGGFVFGPVNICSPGPGETANLMVEVDGLSPGGVLPQFWGAASSTLGLSTGERAIVTVTDATQWSGELHRLEDVRAGMELEAVGVRQPDCTILAQTILTPLAPPSPLSTP